MTHFNLPLIAILRGITPEEIVDHANALLEQGFESIEVPTNSPRWQESLQLLRDYCPANTLIGAGTVVNAELLAKLIEIGGKLMVTPNTDPALIQQARQHDLLTCIGALTPSEVLQAMAAGADMIKVFPATLFGPGYIKTLRSITGTRTPFYAVGGINTDNLADYLSAGYRGAGLGSELYRAGQSTATTARQARLFVGAYQRYLEQLTVFPR